MQTLNYGISKPLPAIAAATIGTFDGVHLGHKGIIRQAVESARNSNGPSCVITFDKHPRQVLAPATAPAVLTTLETKLQLIAELGVDYALIVPFTRATAGTDAQVFCEQTIGADLAVKHLFVGENFRFGSGGKGSPTLLQDCGRRLGFTVSVVPLLEIDNQPVSSTRVRSLLARGKVGQVAALLGRDYALTGTIERGHRRGSQLGFPTANVVHDDDLCLPKDGVYAGITRLRGEDFPSVANVGTKPTFGKEKRQLETHIFDFEGDTYGERVSFYFHSRLRGERRFPSVEALAQQIGRDIADAKNLLPS